MDMSKWGRWTVRSLRVAVLTAGLVGGTAAVLAQTPVGPASSPAATMKKTFTKNTSFNLPIQFQDERVRGTLKEVQLYVKSGSSDWVRQEVVSPQSTHFTYRVPQDGEYWFALVTVDRAGKASPSDINAAPPALRVIVDTRPPALDTGIAMEGGEQVLRVNVIDANPNPQSVQAFILTEQGDRALTPMPGQPGAFRLSPGDLNSTIRVTAADLCGNQTSKDLPGRAESSQVMPVSNPPAQQAALPPAYYPQAAPPNVYTPPPMQGNINNTVYRPGIDTDRPGNRKIINTTHASVDYRIDTVGPSGIGRVDIYLSPDKGQTWSKIAEDLDKRSPAEIDLPGEGLFGIRLAVTNGNGFGGKAPKSGDRPSFFIEVDATSPFVQLQPIDMVNGSGAIDIRWTASDNNMAPEPVSLFFRTRPDSNWQPIARNIKNDGVYRWTFPREIGAQFFMKLEVADLAGNVTKVETPTPILLDMTEPEATLVDVTGIQNRGAPGTNVPNSPPPNVVPGRN